MSEAKADTVPGLGFKDQEKAHETLKILEGRDPDYQKLAVKGLLGRAKRTLTVTRDKDKLQNINEAVSIFEKWLKDFEKSSLSRENRAYLPLNAIQALLPLKNEYSIEDKKAEAFIQAYTKVKGEYKNLRTVSSGEEGEQTWDIVRNKVLKTLLDEIDEKDPEMWKDDLPTKAHMELILWAYSPEASKIKKNISTYEEKLGTKPQSPESEDSEEDKEESKGTKRKSSSDDNEDDESPKKKNKN